MNRDEDLFDEMGEEEAYTPSAYDGERSYQPDVAIPIWEDAAAYGGETYRLRIQRLNMDGTRSDLGHIAGDSSEAALINQWPEAGTYLIMPVDEHNRSLRDQPYRRTIASDHLLLKKKRAESGLNDSSTNGMDVSPLIAIMQQQIHAMQEERRAEKRQLEQERQQIAEDKRAVEQRMIALTVEQNASSAELHQQMLQQQQDNFNRMQAQAEQRNQSFMLSFQAMNDARAEDERRRREAEEIRFQQQLERERETRRRDEEERQRQHERLMEREAMRREREIEAMRSGQEYQQRMWEEHAKRREESDRRDREREQEFMQRQLEAVKEQKEPLEVVSKLIKPFGYTIADLIPLITGGGQKSIIETIANTAAEVVKSTVQSGGLQGLVAQAQAAEVEGADEEYIPVQVANGQIAMVPKSALAEIPENEANEAIQIPEQTQQPQQAYSNMEQSNYIDGSAVFGKPGAGPILPPQPVVMDVQATRAPPKPSVPLKIAKPARKAIRMLVGDLSGCEQDEWVAKIVSMIGDTPESLEYLKLVTIRGALVEAGASDDMTNTIIGQLDEPEYKPFTDGIPRG